VARGGGEESTGTDDEGVATFRNLADGSRQARGRLYFEPYPTGSHSKILLRDWEHACIGSFNWLSARPDSPRPELSLLVSNADVAVAICDIAADLLRDDRVGWPAQVLRSRAISASRNSDKPEGLAVRIVEDGDNRECLFAYLEQVEERLLITSDKITGREDPMLHERLLQAARSLKAHSGLTIRYCVKDAEHAPLLVGLADAGATVIEDGLNHMKVLMRDNLRALVTSFNLLSFGGRPGRRPSGFELGIELRIGSNAQELLAKLYTAVESIEKVRTI
jgi:hypothetical protein